MPLRTGATAQLDAPEATAVVALIGSTPATPAVHAATHTDGSDDIQNATAAQKGVATAAQITKLDGIATGADVTGANPPQAHTHPLADITDSGALAPLDTVSATEIDANAVDNTKLADMATKTIKGRDTAATGDPEDLTPAQVNTMLGKITNALTTTDGVFTTIATIPITDDTVNLISAMIVGRRTDAADRIGGRLEALIFREAAGSAALQGAENVAFSRTSDNQFGFQIIVSGNNALVQVKGRAGRTINWESIHEVESVA